MMTNFNLENFLAQENDGKVFKHIYFLQMMTCDKFSYHEEYYTIKDGKVFLIQESQRGKPDFLYPSKDTLAETCGRGIPSGKFDENKKYPRVVKFFDVKDFKKAMKKFLTD
jgi:hypothetical protein